ncbi:MAG: hypothetical protein JRJ79_01110 [Deltaproteobacteria bacterium]|nr:hypothetical protein [Deltaproteobacteria bacterium]MBW2340020.1 hypothetical protein [Deltaproteobacteria bacterium]
MVISTYQVNNVLRVYGDQLRQNRLSSKEKIGDTRSPDKIDISSEAKRKAIIDKIASDIVDKITRYGPHENVEKDVFKQLEDEYGAHLAISKNTPTDLIFKVIDGNGETMNALSIEDSKFLRYKLEEITRDVVDKNMM